MGRYLALKNIRCNDRQILIVRGEWQDHFSAKVWHAVENELIEEATTVRAGSIVEYDLPADRLEKAFRDGVLAEADAEFHFDLDRVFDLQVPNTLSAKTKGTLAAQLRAHDIFTLEDVVALKSANKPLEPDIAPIPLKMFLRNYGSEAQVQMWLRAAKNIVEAGKPAPAAEQETDAQEEEATATVAPTQ